LFNFWLVEVKQNEVVNIIFYNIFLLLGLANIDFFS